MIHSFKLYPSALAERDLFGEALLATLDLLLAAAQRGDSVKILYHSPCPDGFCAAYCAWTLLGETAQYIPYDHDQRPDPAVCAGAFVVQCDCCYKRADLLLAIGQSKGFIVLDHHKTARADCGDIPQCSFDLTRSGAGMAWDFFHPGEPMPLLVACVQDRDLHLFNRAQTPSFCAHLDILPMDFQTWDQVAHMGIKETETFLAQGLDMLREFDAQARAMVAQALPCLFFGHRAWLLNAPYRFASRCAALLCEQPGSAMAVIWSSRNLSKVRLSLRSANAEHCDVSTIAVELGGGGHPGSSGAFISIDSLTALVEFVDWPARVANLTLDTA